MRIQAYKAEKVGEKTESFQEPSSIHIALSSAQKVKSLFVMHMSENPEK